METDNSNKIIWAILGVIVIAIAIFWIRVIMTRNAAMKQAETINNQDENFQTPPLQAAQENPQTQASTVKTLTINLSAQNNSGQSGVAMLTDDNGKTKVVLNLNGGPRDIVQPAHIHIGSCANIGGVKYSLTFLRNGASDTVLNVSIDELLKQLPLAINVHKSAGETAIYYSCGDIKNSTPSAPGTGQPTMRNQSQTTIPSPEL